MLRDQFRGHLSREVNKGLSLEASIKRITDRDTLNKVEIEYDQWNDYNSQLLSQGLSGTYKHYFEGFRKLDTALGNVNAGEVENRLNRLRKCIAKKKEYLEWMIKQLASLPPEAFLIFEIKDNTIPNTQNAMKKIFISHASLDHSYVGEVIDLLKSVGVRQEQIFCTSFEGYGIDLGENFLDRIKEELGSDVVVFFMLSHNFFSSAVCLCEMGATWVNSKVHIPILIPPFDFKDIKGVFPLTQGLKINDSSKLNSLKEKIEKEFSISPIHISEWERSKEKFLKAIEVQITAAKKSTTAAV